MENTTEKSHSDMFYPGFTVTCDKCGSIDIEVSNSMGWSEISGPWGSIDFVCTKCRYSVEIFEP